jgi:Cys-rich repeat protein
MNLGRGLAKAISALFLMTSVGTLVVACTGARAANCKVDTDCKAKPPEKDGVCVNSRCVDCHYDGDCKAGEVCLTATFTCSRIGGPSTGNFEEADAGAPPPAPAPSATPDAPPSN